MHIRNQRNKWTWKKQQQKIKNSKIESCHKCVPYLQIRHTAKEKPATPVFFYIILRKPHKMQEGIFFQVLHISIYNNLI